MTGLGFLLRVKGNEFAKKNKLNVFYCQKPRFTQKVASPLPSSLSVASVLSDALSVPVSICKFCSLEFDPSPFRLDALDCVKRDSIV